MAYVAPFRALRYDPKRVSVASAVTQPYDKITPRMQDAYYAASPHNLVRIILGKRSEADGPTDNVYTRAAGCFRDWRRGGIFLQDPEPSIYSYVQRFTVPGTNQTAERRGFIALGRIEDYDAKAVFRHEQTLAKPKADRLDLLRATRAHFGQIFMLYSDNGEVEAVLAPGEPPTVEVEDEYQVQHQVWKVSNPGLIELVRAKMRDKPLIIADGHHRYETALTYRNERRAAQDALRPRKENGARESMVATEVELAPYQLVMMTFVNMNSPGLVILPTHRVVHSVEGFSGDQLQSSAAQYFSVEEADRGMDAQRATAILRQAGREGTALLAIMADRVLLLHQPKMPGSDLLRGFSPRQQSLDVVQLHKCVLEGALGISEQAVREQTHVRYLRDAAEAMEQVRSGEANVAFLMNAARMEQVRDIAFAGEVLPQKSTDFYPKLLSGLTIYALE